MKDKYSSLEIFLEAVNAPDEMREKFKKISKELKDFDLFVTESEGLSSEDLNKVFDEYIQDEMLKKIDGDSVEVAMNQLSNSNNIKEDMEILSENFAKKYNYSNYKDFGKASGELIGLLSQLNEMAAKNLGKN